MRNSIVTVEPSSIVSKGLNIDRQSVDRLDSNKLTVSNRNLIEYSVLVARKIKERKKRYAKAASMLKRWAKENPDYDEKTWSSLEKELQDAAINLRKDHECD